MRAGDLRHRIELQSTTNTSDGMGGQTNTWNTQDQVWAAIWPVSATEQLRAASQNMTITHKIRIRYYANLDASWRIKFGSRYFSIVSIIDQEERHQQMDLLCREA